MKLSLFNKIFNGSFSGGDWSFVLHNNNLAWARANNINKIINIENTETDFSYSSKYIIKNIGKVYKVIS